MLINSVVLLLSDALPIFILISLLWVHLSFNRIWLPVSLIVGLGLTVLLVGKLNSLGNWLEGTGVELILFSIQVINYFLALYLTYQFIHKQTDKKLLIFSASIMLILTIANKGTNFVVYFSGYFGELGALQSMLVGLFLGLGICLSLMILLYFVLTWLDTKITSLISIICIPIYSIGQLTNSLPLLVQVDLINGSETIWDTQNILSDQSELGQLFNVLFGYQATPSFNQFVLYISTLLILLLMMGRANLATFKQGRIP
ncbi:hypothetical protein L0668_14075 [Paraglaciecola aquimarina]|uniref:High-affinity iron transporter n=1 Tax=Paraglaciecola algarum TaxID=3050085 RepID=A0ABS9D8F2_9ALTE|nr:hypothetical protein [Paraglaciecola sp. G1-23]MCF2949242.1 hypothetical protein [Paraglaciecola sp. G1-23]